MTSAIKGGREVEQISVFFLVRRGGGVSQFQFFSDNWGWGDWSVLAYLNKCVMGYRIMKMSYIMTVIYYFYVLI